MEKKKFRKKGGRPRSPEYEKRVNIASKAVLPSVTRSLSRLMDTISAHQTATVTLNDVSEWHRYLSEIVAELKRFVPVTGGTSAN